MAQYKLDNLDKKIIELVLKDARIPFLEVARACNVSGAAIHQRIQKLTNLGVLKGSQYVAVYYKHLRAHETNSNLVFRVML